MSQASSSSRTASTTITTQPKVLTPIQMASRRRSRHRSGWIVGIFHIAAVRPSHALQRFESAGSDCLDEFPEVLLVLIGVALGEVGDRPVEVVVAAEVLGDGDRIS